jgi:adenylate cyclase
MSIYRFKNCLLHLGERRMIKNGNYLELTPKAFEVLQLLVEKGGKIVTKDEILSRVWRGSFVEEGNLPVHVSKLRRLLGESKAEPFIETVQGRGYCFVSPVSAVNEDEWRKHLPKNNDLPSPRISGEYKFDSIAVLPLQNETHDLDIEYLADGMTESFISSLSRLSSLKVIARNTVFRYKEFEVDAKEVGETLGVTAVLTGRVRVIKNNIFISVELVRVADGTQIWGDQFNQPFSEIVEVQEKITRTVSEKLKVQIHHILSPSALNYFTQDAESYRLYLKGKYFLEKRLVEDTSKAIECFNKSLSYDPTNILSYVEMIESYFALYNFDHISSKEALSKIKPLLRILSQLNQTVDVLQSMYGLVKMYLEWDFEAAEKHLQQALALNPNCVIAHYRYSSLLMIFNRFSEALEALHQIMLIDPLSLLNNKRIARLFYKMGRCENAIVYLKEALELEPNDYEALMLLGGSLTELGNYEEALALFQKSLKANFNIETLAMIGYANALAGNRAEARQIIRQIESFSNEHFNHAIKLARINVALGEKEKAYEWLEDAFNQHEIDMPTLNADPRWAKIRQEPRFRELMRRVGMPETAWP